MWVQNTVKPGLYESQGTAENIRITQTFVQIRLSMYRRGFRRDRAKNSYNPRFRTTQIRVNQVWLYLLMQIKIDDIFVGVHFLVFGA